MRQPRFIPALGMIIATAVAVMATTGASVMPVATSSQAPITTEVIDESTTVVTVDIPDTSGMDGTTEVVIVDSRPREIVVDVGGDTTVDDTFVVEDFQATSAESFTATVRSQSTGESTLVDTARAQQQIAPIVVALVVFGLKAALKIGGKAVIKEAAKKAILGLNANKWNHIMASKHNWSRLAKTKDQVADLMADTMTNGTRIAHKNHIEFTWSHRGQTIVVRTSHEGHISDGWIVK